MDKYTIYWHDRSKNNAGVKAKEDTVSILRSMGYTILDTPRSRVFKIVYVFFIYRFIIKRLKPGILLLQFPSGSPRLRRKLIELTKKNKSIRLVMLVHDIEAIRTKKGEREKKSELACLKKADGIISLNSKMTAYLKNNGISAQITELEIWDYINTNDYVKFNGYTKSICIAGNVRKSQYLSKLRTLNKIYVYGPNFDKNKICSSSIIYKGVYTPDDLSKHMFQDFGLIWDGEYVDTCKGEYGEYLKYNNPHKASLYISSGMPVIVWKNAAIAEFIVKNEIGITIDNLNNLDDLLESVDETKMSKLRENTKKIGKLLREGYFLKRAVKRMERKLM